MALRWRLNNRAGGKPMPNGAVSVLGIASGIDTAQDDRRARRPPVCEQERAAEENRLGEHDVCRLCGVGGHDRLVLQLGGSGEDVLDVEGDRFERPSTSRVRESCSMSARSSKSASVGNGTYDAPVAATLSANSDAGDEPYVVAALDEVLGDGQQRCHVTVRRKAGNDDR